MRIVQLERNLLVQMVNVSIMLLIVLLDGGLYGSRDEEVLLAKTKLLTREVVVVRIEDLDDITRHVLVLYGCLVVTLIELLETEGLLRLGIPYTEGIHDMIAIADHWCIVRNRDHGLIALLNELQLAVLVMGLHPAAELDFLLKLCTTKLERVAVSQPVIRHLTLIAVLDLLLEHTILVADATATRPVVEGSERIQEAGCETSEATVSECPVRLRLLECIEIQSQLLDGLLQLFMTGQIQDVVTECTAHQELHGKVVHALRVLLLCCLLGLHPVVNDDVLDGIRHRVKCFLCVQILEGSAVQLARVGFHRLFKCNLVEFFHHISSFHSQLALRLQSFEYTSGSRPLPLTGTS